MSLDNVSAIKQAIENLEEEDYRDLSLWINSDERKRRQSLAASEAAKAEVLKDMIANGVVEGPKREDLSHLLEQKEEGMLPDLESLPAWVEPGKDYLKMYIPGSVVQHNGRVYNSTFAGLNRKEPGAEGVYVDVWEDITDRLYPPKADPETDNYTNEDFVQPRNIEMAYDIGDEVIFNGTRYRSVIKDNMYSPETYPDGWERV
nr:MAG TPA: ChiA1-BD-binding domain protein [Caudoviricetes sp.]